MIWKHLCSFRNQTHYVYMYNMVDARILCSPWTWTLVCLQQLTIEPEDISDFTHAVAVKYSKCNGLQKCKYLVSVTKNQRCFMKMIHTCSDLVTFVGSLHIITHSLGSINRTNDTAEKKLIVALFSLSYMIIFPL